MKYFVGRMTDIEPFRVYNSERFFETTRVVFRSNSLEEARHKCKHFNASRQKLERALKQSELFPCATIDEEEEP